MTKKFVGKLHITPNDDTLIEELAFIINEDTRDHPGWKKYRYYYNVIKFDLDIDYDKSTNRYYLVPMNSGRNINMYMCLELLIEIMKDKYKDFVLNGKLEYFDDYRNHYFIDVKNNEVDIIK